MTHRDLIAHRLAHQQISNHIFKNPGKLVSWMGAVQAQDYLNSLWAIGLRLENVTEKDVEGAIKNKSIVRTWPMRGTLHFVSPLDVRWMLKFLTPRIIARSAGRYRQLELTKTTFLKSARLLEKAFEKSKSLTRNEMYAVLEKGKISITDLRGIHILVHLAQEGLICCGPRQGKQHTFVLMDDWLPSVKEIKQDEALAKLALSYFSSHGPATIADFAWWSGLTTTDAKKGLELVKRELSSATVGDQVHWFLPMKNSPGNLSRATYLLPNYDEYVVGYKDRSHLNVDIFNDQFSRNNMVFNNIIVNAGQLSGQWKRILKKDTVEINYKFFQPKVNTSPSSFSKTALAYSRFLGMPLK
jgi:hypothetical protein